MQFYKYKAMYLIISVTVLVVGIFSIVRFGYQYSIDFVGGTTLQYQMSKPVTEKQVQDVLATHPSKKRVVDVNGTQVTIRLDAQKSGNEDAIYQALSDQLGQKITILQVQTVGPTLGAETIRKTLIASALAVLVIFVYIALSFKGVRFAAAAICALIHDMVIVLGVYSLIGYFFGAEFDALFVTALLTTMSFSVHDTIVIFDKIRELRRYDSGVDIEVQADRALLLTLNRSINNSMTIIFMLLALVLMGGVTIKFFVLALLIGTITGTYSSPFVATPILVYLEKLRSPTRAS